jgi:hypothetical protein
MRILLATLFLLNAATATAAPGEWSDDLNSLVNELRTIHPLARTCGIPPAVEAQRAQLAGEIDQLTDAQAFVALQRLLAGMGDGHTLLWPFGMKRGQLKRAPLSLWLFEDGLFVTQAASPALVGRQVTSIGNVPIPLLLERLRPYVSSDNDMQFRWAAPLYLTFVDFLMAVGGATSRDQVTFTFANASDVTVQTVDVKVEDLQLKLPPPSNDPPLYLSTAEGALTQPIGKDGLYIRVASMSDAAHESLAAFATRLRTELAGKRFAVLDLRLNNGGEASLSDELLRTMIAFDVSGGQIATLISRMTFSAAETFASRLDQWSGTIFVGEATGSKPNHYGNERTFKLPHSALRGSIASGLNQPVTARDERTTIEPDVKVPLRSSDYFAGHDPALAAAIEALRR